MSSPLFFSDSSEESPPSPPLVSSDALCKAASDGNSPPAMNATDDRNMTLAPVCLASEAITTESDSDDEDSKASICDQPSKSTSGHASDEGLKAGLSDSSTKLTDHSSSSLSGSSCKPISRTFGQPYPSPFGSFTKPTSDHSSSSLPGSSCKPMPRVFGQPYPSPFASFTRPHFYPCLPIADSETHELPDIDDYDRGSDGLVTYCAPAENEAFKKALRLMQDCVRKAACAFHRGYCNDCGSYSTFPLLQQTFWANEQVGADLQALQIMLDLFVELKQDLDATGIHLSRVGSEWDAQSSLQRVCLSKSIKAALLTNKDFPLEKVPAWAWYIVFGELRFGIFLFYRHQFSDRRVEVLEKLPGWYRFDTTDEASRERYGTRGYCLEKERKNLEEAIILSKQCLDKAECYWVKGVFGPQPAHIRYRQHLKSTLPLFAKLEQSLASLNIHPEQVVSERDQMVRHFASLLAKNIKMTIAYNEDNVDITQIGEWVWQGLLRGCNVQRFRAAQTDGFKYHDYSAVENPYY